MSEYDNNPESFHLFIVGHCKEWPENRREQGDEALYHEYLNAGVPPDQIRYVKDGDCTMSNCQDQLENFLQSMRGRNNATFMFYYGGHGVAKGFRTKGSIWLYADVCATIHRLFSGKRILFLLDCCDSGNMSEHFPVTDQRKWVLFANSPPFIPASDEGEEWVVTNSWIRGMRCITLPTLTTMMEFLADRLAIVLGDQGFAFLQATSDKDWDPSIDRSWMPRGVNHLRQQEREESLNWPRLQFNIPKEAQAIYSGGCSVGDWVVYKHCGGSVENSSLQFTPPMWVFGKVVSVLDSQRVQLQVHHPSKPLEKWTVCSNKSEVISGLWMAQQWSLPKPFYKAQVQLAKDWKFIDFSALSVDSKVTVRPGMLTLPRQAVLVDWRKFNWQPFTRAACTLEESFLATSSHTTKPPLKFHFGPHIPIQWSDTKEYDLIPLVHVTSPPITMQSYFPDPQSKLQSLMEQTNINGLDWCRKEIALGQRQALLQSIQSAGKTIVNAKYEFGSNVKAYWPNEDKWYNAKVIDLDPTSALSLDILASHARFPLEGEFAAISYAEDDEALSPTYYLRKGGLRLCC
jgi:hypothetical protein